MKYLAVFENDRFVAVDKPSGVLTVPGRAGGSDPRRCLSIDLSRARRVWPVHRLDYEVSGLVLFAKDADAHRAANGWFESREIHKTYEAWSEGAPPSEWQPNQSFEWSCLLARGKKRAFESPHGKPAVTRATWVGAVSWHEQSFLSWRLEPLTGRSHQLRFELARHGFPIVGDALYGAKVDFGNDSIALRSIALDFSGCSAAKLYELPPLIVAAGLAEADR